MQRPGPITLYTNNHSLPFCAAGQDELWERVAEDVTFVACDLAFSAINNQLRGDRSFATAYYKFSDKAVEVYATSSAKTPVATVALNSLNPQSQQACQGVMQWSRTCYALHAAGCCAAAPVIQTTGSATPPDIIVVQADPQPASTQQTVELASLSTSDAPKKPDADEEQISRLQNQIQELKTLLKASHEQIASLQTQLDQLKQSPQQSPSSATIPLEAEALSNRDRQQELEKELQKAREQIQALEKQVQDQQNRARATREKAQQLTKTNRE